MIAAARRPDSSSSEEESSSSEEDSSSSEEETHGEEAQEIQETQEASDMPLTCRKWSSRSKSLPSRLPEWVAPHSGGCAQEEAAAY